MTQDQEKAYTSDFINRRGPETVARETGINRQTIRQIANSRNGPGRRVIAALIATYPDYDLKGLLLGKETSRTLNENDQAAGNNDLEVKLLREQNAELKRQLAELKAERDGLMVELRENSAMQRELIRQGFPASSSNLPAPFYDHRPVVAGFVQTPRQPLLSLLPMQQNEKGVWSVTPRSVLLASPNQD